MKIEIQALNLFGNMVSFMVGRSQFDELQALLDKQKKGVPLVAEIKPKRKKRSTSANGKCWAICEEIARELSKDGEIYTGEDVYKQAIRDYGYYVDKNIPGDLVQDWIKLWDTRGIGWTADEIAIYKDHSEVRCYVGSSWYDTAQMSRLLDGLKADAEALGIMVLTDSERALLLDEWEKMEATNERG